MLRHRSADRDSILRDTFAVIMAGGEGTRLGRLTRCECKPALPIAGHYRNIDFSLSNCVNSGIRRIGLLTQYQAHSLILHIQRNWNLLRPEFGECLELWPAQQGAGMDWYLGTADAVRQNIDIIDDHQPKLVLVLAGDHIYAMDYLPMLEAHLRTRADVTLGCVDVPLCEASAFGTVDIDATDRVTAFREKPTHPSCMPDRADRALASMGIYVFSYPALRRWLTADARTSDSRHDFGRDILPGLVETAHVQAYRFVDQASGEPGYWRDVGTVENYWRTNMELLGEPPPIDLYDQGWPILTGRCQHAPARITADGAVTHSIVAAGCQVSGDVTHAVLSEDVVVRQGAVVERSVLLPDAVIGRNCTIRHAIIDSHCHVPDGTVIDGRPPERRTQGEAVGGITLVTAETLATQGVAAANQLNVA